MKNYFLTNEFFRFFCFIMCITFMTFKTNPLLAQQAAVQTSDVINISSDRELFVDDFLVDRLLGKAEFRLPCTARSRCCP